MWTTYLPNSELSWVEYDATCAEVYREIIEQQGGGKLYVGDQANVTFLNTIIADHWARRDGSTMSSLMTVSEKTV